ncbi:MAG: DUF2520 domain-containing protein [Phycisphaerales bacterium]|nr:DUF2520 domain-containing protein [Phycisphaerales bacterium]
MNFSIIGTGNMAWFLTEQLSKAGLHCSGIWGRDASAANQLAKEFACTAYNSVQEIEDQEQHFCFLAIKDTAIPTLAKELQFEKTILIHTAGASSIHLLDAAAKHRGVFWSIYSIVKNVTLASTKLPIAIEGSSKETEALILQVAQKISTKAFAAQEYQRMNLHLGAVFANNFSNHLMAVAAEICAQADVSFEYLKPIVAQTFERLQTESAKQLQTGPAIRDDKMTMQKHLDLLKSNPDWALLYEYLSASIRKMYTPKAE